MNYIAHNLRFLRNRLKISQEALAEEIGLNRGNIASYEKGSAEPNASRLLLICRFFEVSLSDFIEKDFSIEAPQAASPPRQLGREEWAELQGGLTQIRKIVGGLAELHILRKAEAEAGSIDTLELMFDHGRLIQAAERLLHIAEVLQACVPDSTVGLPSEKGLHDR